MKTQNNILFVITTVIITITACQYFTKETGNTVGVIIDCSDSFPETRRELTIEKLKPLLAVSHNPHAGSTVLFAKISSIRHNPFSIQKIEGEAAVNANILQREKLRDSFYARIEENIRSITSSPSGADGSFVLYTIAQMLQKLAASCSDCGKGTKLLVFSDLEEHNPAVFSVYNKRHLTLLKSNPDSVYVLWDKEYPLPPTFLVEIIFIYQPGNDKKADERYAFLSQAMKAYYQKRHGYKVAISATIPEE